MKEIQGRFKENIQFILSIITTIIAVFISIYTVHITTRQNEFDNSLKLIESKINDQNALISKVNFFSSLMTQFIKGSDEEKEYSLILMTQIDSVLAYKIIARLIKIEEKKIQPTLKKFLINEARQIQKSQTLINDPMLLESSQKNNMPKRILGDLYKLTQFEDIKEETGESLKELDYCDKLNTAKLLYKIQHYEDAFQMLQEVNNSLPNDKKLSRTDLERIKYALNNDEFEKAFTIYSQAFKELCP